VSSSSSSSSSTSSELLVEVLKVLKVLIDIGHRDMLIKKGTFNPLFNVVRQWCSRRDRTPKGKGTERLSYLQVLHQGVGTLSSLYCYLPHGECPSIGDIIPILSRVLLEFSEEDKVVDEKEDKEEEIEALVEVCRGLTTMSTHTPHLILDSKVIYWLVEQLNHTNVNLQSEILEILTKLSLYDEEVQEIVDVTVIPALSQLLFKISENDDNDDNNDLLETLSSLIYSITFESLPRIESVIKTTNIVPLLLSITKQSRLLTKKESLWAIVSIVNTASLAPEILRY
jgi:hypothetical protein